MIRFIDLALIPFTSVLEDIALSPTLQPYAIASKMTTPTLPQTIKGNPSMQPHEEMFRLFDKELQHNFE